MTNIDRFFFKYKNNLAIWFLNKNKIFCLLSAVFLSKLTDFLKLILKYIWGHFLAPIKFLKN